LSQTLKDLQDLVLSYPKLKARIESRDNPKAETTKALKNLDEIRADFSSTVIKTFEKVLDATLSQLYDGINLNATEVDFPKLVKENCVVLVPNHQSHADYVAINYKVFKQFGFNLFVAGGNNLNIFPIGTLFRKCGCFFIRRSFQNDALYKLTLEAYLFSLLYERKPIEFFFEGGRSRSGKLLPPRYGLYQMLIEAHMALPDKQRVPLVFLPVSIAHEYVPEQKSLTSELQGKKKKKESTRQLFGLFKLLAYQFGNVHINFGKPVKPDMSKTDLKQLTQDLAFECFRQVGNRMVVTPTSLLALIMLDEPAGALKWNDILASARQLTAFAERFSIPLTPSLASDELEDSLGRAMDILISHKKIDVIGQSQRGGHVFYAINGEARPEILYFKNTILHHFLVPWTINSAWMNLFNGSVQTVDDLKKLFLIKRDQLKHEFYLPTVKEFFKKTFDVLYYCIGREIKSLDECIDLSHRELYAILSKIGLLARSCNYLYEGYYVSALTLKLLHDEKPAGVKIDDYLKRVKTVFLKEMELAKVVKFPESDSEPLMRNSLKYFTQQGLIETQEGLIKVIKPEELDRLIDTYETELSEQWRFQLKASIN